MTTSKDVAKLAGVSIATVSRVFSGQNHVVQPKTLAKVLQAADTLGYAPNQLARSLKSQRSNIIGLLIPNISNPVFLQVMNILATDLKQYGFNLLVSFCDENDEDEYLNILNMLSACVAAIIFTPVCHNDALLRQLQMNHIYALQLNRKMYDELDAVLWDDDDGTYRATQHLIQQGFRRIMLLGPLASRRHGFERALQTAGIQPQAEQLLITSDIHIDEALLRNGLSHYRPDAVISIAHETSYRVLNLFKEWKWSYPKDVSLICYDDDELTRFLDITVIAHDLDSQGHISCDLLVDALSREPYSQPPIIQLMKTTLIQRSSVRSAHS